MNQNLLSNPTTNNASAFSSNTNSDVMFAPSSQDMFSNPHQHQSSYNYHQQHPSTISETDSNHHHQQQYSAVVNESPHYNNNNNFDTNSVSGFSGKSYKTSTSNGTGRNAQAAAAMRMMRSRGDSDLIYSNRIESGLIDSTRAVSSLLSQKQELDHPAFDSVYIFVFMACGPIFAAYGSVVSLQERIRTNMNITGSSPEAQTFDYAISTLFYVILAVRFFHNVIFSCLRPRNRVILGYIFVIVALCLLVFTQFLASSELGTHLNSANHIYLIFLIYILAGIGISTFECNFISCITPLGPTSKKFSILSMPLGYNGISIAAFTFFAFSPNDIDFVWITLLIVAILNVFALIIFIVKIPDLQFERTSSLSLREFLNNFSGENFKLWMYPLLPNFLAFFCDMFVVILLSGAPEFVYDVPHVALVPHSSVTVPKNVFLAVFNICAFLGDLVSRWVGYRVQDLDRFRFSPMEFMLMSIVGGVMAMSTVAFLAWIGMFLAMFANGFIYSSTMRRLDRDLERRHHLTALSLWLLAGDSGSSIGSTLTHKLAKAVGSAG